MIMKIVQAFILWMCSLVFGVCISIILGYSLLSQTVLQPSVVKGWVADSGTYAKFTDAVIIPAITQDGTSGSTQGLISNAMIATAATTIQPSFIQSSSETIIDATYAWLNSDASHIAYTISTKPATTTFYDSLHDQIVTKLKALPPCSRGATDPQLTINGVCLMSSLSVATTADEITASLRSSGPLKNNSINETTFAPAQSPPNAAAELMQNLPVDLSYAWLANLMAWPTAMLAALFIILNRRARGCISVGTAVLLPGLLFVVASAVILSHPPDVSALVGGSDANINALLAGIAKVAIPSLAHVAQFIGIVASSIGIIFITAGYIWRHESKLRAKRAEEVKASQAVTPEPAPVEAAPVAIQPPIINKIPVTTFDDPPENPWT